jgi:hypothetical protein
MAGVVAENRDPAGEIIRLLPRTIERPARDCGDEPRSETVGGAQTPETEDFRIGVDVLNFPEGQRPKATDVSPWYGVYFTTPDNS